MANRHHPSFSDASKCICGLPMDGHPSRGGPSDKEMLDYLEQESLDLRCHDAPTGGGDADVMWRVIGHYMAAPKERQVGETGANPREAIASAMRAQERGLAAIAAGK